MDHFHAKFDTGCFYHIYNRGNNKENLFFNQENYNYFLNKWDKYFADYLDVWTYCLLPNHFHFLVEVKDISNFTKPQRFSKVNPNADELINKILENQFMYFFRSYALSINKQQKRSGSLFEKRFKRILVDSDDYITTLIHYIHNNPIHHGIVKNYADWKYSSYNAILSNGNTIVNRHKVLGWFIDKNEFIQFHKEAINYKKIEKYVIENDDHRFERKSQGR